MTEDNRKLNIAVELEQSKDALRAAETLLGVDLLRDAANRLYDAVSHATHAVLLSQGLEPKSHKGLVSLFGLHFIMPAVLPAELNETLIRLQGYREAADYARGFTPTEAEFRRNLAAAHHFVATVRTWLVSGGLT